MEELNDAKVDKIFKTPDDDNFVVGTYVECDQIMVWCLENGTPLYLNWETD